MLYVLVGMSLLFIAIGFTVTANNARYLLSGYNTMKEEDRKRVDIHSYIRYFRKFHIFFGTSFLIFGTTTYFINENASGIFLAVYPIAAYIYFIATSSRYFRSQSTAGKKIGIATLVATLLFVIALLGYGFTENKISIDSHQIILNGSYGETLTPSDIEYIELVHALPQIKMKTNGFALGTINKGYFKTKEGEIVKLILNSDQRPVILITKVDGSKIYYSAKDKPNEEVMNEIKKVFIGIKIK